MAWLEDKDIKKGDKVKPKQEVLYSDGDVRNWLNEKPQSESKICCMLYGSDGVGKTGIALDYLNDDDIKAGHKMVIIDLDGGNLPLLKTYHKDKLDNLKCINPLVTKETDNGTEIDYVRTYAKIRATIRYVKNNYQTEKIKAIVFDGLSTALKVAEHRMRLEKNIDADGGIQTRFWLIRNKLFLETLEMIKTIPIARFFVAHEDFIPNERNASDLSSVKAKTNQMSFQKLKCKRECYDEQTKFIVVVDKNKYDVCTEGKEITFCKVDSKKGEVKWNTKKIFEMLA